MPAATLFPLPAPIPSYFVVMIDYGRRGREAIVDPEVTRREVVSRIRSGEYSDVLFIQYVAPGCIPQDVTGEIMEEAAPRFEEAA